MNKKVGILLLVTLLLSSIILGAYAIDLGLLGNLFGTNKQTEEDTVRISRAEYERFLKYQKLEEVYQYIDTYYYIEPDYDQMMEGAVQGMLAYLKDPFTFYYNAEDWKKLWEDDEGEYAGIGIQLLGNYRTNIVTISRIFKDTPAEEAGLRKGDIITRVEDVVVTALTMQDAVDIMRGKVDETVEIEIERKGEPIVFEIPRATIHVNWIEHTMLDNHVGYICLYEFAGDCDEKLPLALKDLEKQGATSLILDLRDNGGGWVEAAKKIADIFVDKEMIYYSEDRQKNRDIAYTTEGKDDIPLVILVNEASASSSEILSGALQELNRATLVGTKTYGKGIIQSVIPLSSKEDGMQFTSAQYYMPSGKEVHKKGIMPNIYVTMPEELVGTYFELGDMTDVQLKTAWETALALQNGTELPKGEEPPKEEDVSLLPAA